MRTVIRAGLALVFLPSLLLAGGGGEKYPDLKTNEQALAAWQAMRFGMFIHWGPVSLKGTEIGWSRGDAVPRAEYDQLYKRFNPVQFNAERWVRIAKDAGMKYIILTSKHHDGFCLWDSAYTDYDIMATPFGRDVVKELADACRRQDVPFGVYYSILDWHHGDYLPQSHGGPADGRPPEKADFQRYVAYMKNQLAELERSYGPLGFFWFDGEWEKTWTADLGADLYVYCRGLRDDILINNRVGKGRQGMRGMSKSERFAGDYGTPEQEVGAMNRRLPWETCMTIGTQWAWKPNDKIKSLKECLRTLVMTVCGDGNLLLNVGPMPDGRIEPRQADLLGQMGAWLDKYGQTVYGTRGGPFQPGQWGGSTSKDNRIYLHLFGDQAVSLPAIPAKVTRATALTGGEVSFEQTAAGLQVSVPEQNLDEIDTIICLELDRPAAFELQ